MGCFQSKPKAHSKTSGRGWETEAAEVIPEASNAEQPATNPSAALPGQVPDQAEQPAPSDGAAPTADEEVVHRHTVPSQDGIITVPSIVVSKQRVRPPEAVPPEEPPERSEARRVSKLGALSALEAATSHKSTQSIAKALATPASCAASSNDVTRLPLPGDRSPPEKAFIQVDRLPSKPSTTSNDSHIVLDPSIADKGVALSRASQRPSDLRSQKKEKQATLAGIKGTWERPSGAFCCYVENTTVRWPSRNTSQIEIRGSQVVLTVKGTAHTAPYDIGKLLWSDGDIWNRPE